MELSSISTSTTTTRGKSLIGFQSSSDSSSLIKTGKSSLRFQSALHSHPIKTKSQSLLSEVRFSSAKPNRFKILSLRNDAPIAVEGRCMEDIYDELARRLLPMATMASNNNSKYIVGLAGSPGAGKSTLASEVARRVNMLWPQEESEMDSPLDPPDIATVLPMDGFHLYRHQLDAMENSEEAHARRGAPWTFDPARLLTCMKTLRSQGSVLVPSFDHGVGDPVEDDIFVRHQHRVVIVEGNYLLLDEGIWKEVSSVFDEKWFIEVDIDMAMQRVLKRHISTGKPPDIAKWRIEHNDRPNAELINKSKANAGLVIRSVDL